MCFSAERESKFPQSLTYNTWRETSESCGARDSCCPSVGRGGGEVKGLELLDLIGGRDEGGTHGADEGKTCGGRLGEGEKE